MPAIHGETAANARENLWRVADVRSPWDMGAYAGTVQTVYLDPPFGTGRRFALRRRIGNETVDLPLYTDKSGREEYLAMLRTALETARTLLREDGSIFVHVDWRVSAHVRLLLDEVFGESCFVNEIIWHYSSGGRTQQHFARKHDTIFFYGKTPQPYFDASAVATARGREARNHLRRAVDTDGRVYFAIRSGGREYRYYEDDPVYPDDVWSDISHLQQRDPERTGYATQKPEALLERIIRCTTRPGDIVADLFAGSGTAALCAARLERRFLCADAAPVALHTARERLAKYAAFSAAYDTAYELTSPEDAGVSAAFDGASVVLTPTDNEAPLLLIPDAPLLWHWAVGTVEDGVFRAHARAFRPSETSPLTLELPRPAGETYLQLVLTDGSMRFCRVGEVL